MTELLCNVIVVAFLPLVLAVVGEVIRLRQDVAFDHHYPREQIASLKGLGSRVYAAQQNAWEAVAMFTPCALVAHILDPGLPEAGIVSIVFVAARILHGIMYCLDLAWLRTAAWLVGVGCCGYLVYLVW